MEQSLVVAFIGLGNAGRNMAANVAAAGFTLVAGDIDAERERTFVAEHPGVLAGSDCGYASADIVITTLPNGVVVREALLDGGIAATLAPGTIVVDMSSSAPAGTLELAADLAAVGLVLVDAPVSMATPDGAWSRGLTLMVGGDDDAVFERIRPVLESMSENVFRVGPLGSGHALKTLNNFISSAGFVATLDALAAGVAYGLDPETMIDVFNVSTARNFATSYPVRQEALTRRYASGFQIGLFVKDLGIACDVMQGVGADESLAALLRERMREVREELGYAADAGEAIEFWERRVGVSIAPAPAAS